LDDVTASKELLRPDFAKLAPLAATIPKWCDADHPIGKAYQAADYVLRIAFPRGHGASLVPAAYRICEGIDAVLAERDQRRRRDYPDSPTDAYLLRALWIERRSMRAIARETGRHRKRLQERVDAALEALTTTLGTPRHFAILSEKSTPIGRKSVFQRPKPQPRLGNTKSATPSSGAEVATMVADYLAAGGQIHKAPTGLTRDHREAARVFRSGAKDRVLTDPSGKPGDQRHLRQYAQPRKGSGKHAKVTAPRGVPAQRLPRAIKDLRRIGNAKSHPDEVWRFLFGFGGPEEKRDQEEKENRELVEEFLDPETRERRAELEPKLNEQSSRGKRRRALLTQAFLKGKQGEIRRREIIERGCRRMAWVKQLTLQRRAPKPFKRTTRQQRELERQADAILKEVKK
jgi:hypothetical protein